VLSNHIHHVIKLMPQEDENWTDNEVLERWTHLSLIIYKWPACRPAMSR
jgi:hypothetical protein